MATWVRQGTGTAPSQTDLDLIGDYALDNAVAPGDFDPAGVTSVRIQWTVTGSGFSDDSWDNVAGVALETGATEISQHAAEGSTGNQNVARSSDATDSTGIPTGLSIADWEAALVRGDGVSDAWCLWVKNMGPDGSTLTASALTVTITYTPGATPGTITQEAYRFRDHANANVALNDASFGVAQNTTMLVNPSRRFRLRMQIGAVGGAGDLGLNKLQYQRNAGAWTDVAVNSPGDSSLRTVGQISAVEMVENSAYADQDPTTDVLTGGTGTFVAGDGMDTTNSCGAITLNDSHTELEWSLWFHLHDDDGVPFFADGDTIQFRLVRGNGLVIDSYAVTPQVTVDVPDGYIGLNAIESPGHHGPFIDTNGNMYAVVETDAHNALPLVIKSSDGITWNPVDVAGAPTKADLEGFDVRQEGDVLHMAHWATGGTDGVFYHRFNLSDHASPDQWAEIDTVVDDGGGAGLARRDQSVAMEVLSNGDLRILYTYLAAPVEIGMRSRISGTWDTSTTVIWDNANGDFRGVTSVIDPATDIIYAFAKDDATADLTGKAILANGTRQNLFADTETAVGTLVDDDLDNTLRHEMNYTPPILWDDGGTKKVWISFLANTEQLHGRLVTVGSGGSVSVRRGPINDSEQIGGNVGQGRMPNATIARDSGGTLHAIFDRTVDAATTATDGDLYHATSTDDGATWGTDTLVGSRSWGSRIAEVRSKFITRGGTDYIGYVFYDANQYEEDLGLATVLDHDAAEFQGYMWYDEIALVSGVDFDNEEATETDTADEHVLVVEPVVNVEEGTETSTAVDHALTVEPVFMLETATETSTAAESTFSTETSFTLEEATETDTAFETINDAEFVLAVEGAIETDTAFDSLLASEPVVNVEEATETSSAVESALTTEPVFTLEAPSTLDTASDIEFGPVVALDLESATETDTAQDSALTVEPVFEVEVAITTDTANESTFAPEIFFDLEAAATLSTAGDHLLRPERALTVEEANETDTAGEITLDADANQPEFFAETASETDTAQDATFAVETAFAAEVASTTDIANDHSLLVEPALDLEAPTETDTALDMALTTDLSEPEFFLGPTTETDTPDDHTLIAEARFEVEEAVDTSTADDSALTAEPVFEVEVAVETSTALDSTFSVEIPFVVEEATETDTADDITLEADTGAVDFFAETASTLDTAAEATFVTEPVFVLEVATTTSVASEPTLITESLFFVEEATESDTALDINLESLVAFYAAPAPETDTAQDSVLVVEPVFAVEVATVISTAADHVLATETTFFVEGATETDTAFEVGVDVQTGTLQHWRIFRPRGRDMAARGRSYGSATRDTNG